MNQYEAIIDRAYALVRPAMRRPDRGLALPFGLDSSESMRWRMSPDVRATLIAGSTGFVGVSLIPEERLFGIRIEVDDNAPERTLELRSMADSMANRPNRA